MYDSDDEIRAKRKRLLIIIGVVAVLILLLIIFLVSGKSKKKSNTPKTGQISCELEVKNVASSPNNTYNQEVEVGFKVINLLSNEPEYAVQKSTVGTTDNSRNKDTYRIAQSGTYTLHGYIQDKSGNKGTCDITVTVSLSKPSCTLEVISGTLGENEWYRSNVEVGFGTMSSNSDTASIVKYYIEKENQIGNTNDAVRNDPVTGNTEKYIVEDNKTTNLIGHVIDSNGNEGTCRIEIKKDSDEPACTLKVNSGTLNSNDEYTDEPEIVIEDAYDDTSELVGKGIGVKENYTSESYKVTTEGSTTVYGYVKDIAGNKGTCSIEIKRPVKKQEEPPVEEPPVEKPKNLLADIAKVGEYVHYDNSTYHGVTCNSKDTGSKDGWIVLSINNGEVTLIHAGITECVKFELNGNSSSTLSTINGKASKYKNSYAKSASILSCSNAGIKCNNDTYSTYLSAPYNVGAGYFLATTSNDTGLWFVSEKGMLRKGSGYTYGIRPIVVLKSEIKVTGGAGTEDNPYKISN